MKHKTLKGLSDDSFRRLTGVYPETFKKMLAVLLEAELKLKARGGRPSLLPMAERLLMALEYLREYRTYFHIAQSYGIREPTCYRQIRWIEDTLIKSREFSLPGRKELVKSDMQYEVVLIDATETPIERPKKNSAVITPVKRKGTR